MTALRSARGRCYGVRSRKYWYHQGGKGVKQQQECEWTHTLPTYAVTLGAETATRLFRVRVQVHMQRS